MDIDINKIKQEKKTLNRGIRWKPSVLEMLRFISEYKHVSMTQELENYTINEYKRIIEKIKKERE